MKVVCGVVVAAVVASLAACASESEPGTDGDGSGGTLGGPTTPMGTGGVAAPTPGTGGVTAPGMTATPPASTGGSSAPPSMEPAGSGGVQAPPMMGTGGVMTAGMGAPPMMEPPMMNPPSEGGCGQTLPAVTDYGQMGPFTPMTMNGSGPNGQYTMVRPATLGENGFLHPVATWGNGITTTPALYPGLLNAIASHGFVVIASNSTNVTAALMTQGLEWLIQQNTAAGALQGKLDTDCAITIGYSLGGGAAVGSGNHPAVKATVSFHGLQGPAENLSGPLLLFTSTGDTFVTKSGFVQPCYNRSSKVPTILATLDMTAASHLYPLNDAGLERAPAIAWLRLWVYGDQGGRNYFYGADCLLCKSPWTDIQRKNAMW